VVGSGSKASLARPASASRRRRIAPAASVGPSSPVGAAAQDHACRAAPRGPSFRATRQDQLLIAPLPLPWTGRANVTVVSPLPKGCRLAAALECRRPRTPAQPAPASATATGAVSPFQKGAEFKHRPAPASAALAGRGGQGEGVVAEQQVMDRGGQGTFSVSFHFPRPEKPPLQVRDHSGRGPFSPQGPLPIEDGRGAFGEGGRVGRGRAGGDHVERVRRPTSEMRRLKQLTTLKTAGRESAALESATGACGEAVSSSSMGRPARRAATEVTACLSARENAFRRGPAACRRAAARKAGTGATSRRGLPRRRRASHLLFHAVHPRPAWDDLLPAGRAAWGGGRLSKRPLRYPGGQRSPRPATRSRPVGPGAALRTGGHRGARLAAAHDQQRAPA